MDISAGVCMRTRGGIRAFALSARQRHAFTCIRVEVGMFRCMPVQVPADRRPSSSGETTSNVEILSSGALKLKHSCRRFVFPVRTSTGTGCTEKRSFRAASEGRRVYLAPDGAAIHFSSELKLKHTFYPSPQRARPPFLLTRTLKK